MLASRGVIGIEGRLIRKQAISTGVNDHCRPVIIRRHGATIQPVEGISIRVEESLHISGHMGGYSREVAARCMRARYVFQ